MISNFLSAENLKVWFLKQDTNIGKQNHCGYSNFNISNIFHVKWSDVWVFPSTVYFNSAHGNLATHSVKKSLIGGLLLSVCMTGLLLIYIELMLQLIGQLFADFVAFQALNQGTWIMTHFIIIQRTLHNLFRAKTHVLK